MNPLTLIDRAIADLKQLRSEWATIDRQTQEQFGGWPATASGAVHDPESSDEFDPVPLTGTERAALHNGLGRAYLVNTRMRSIIRQLPALTHEAIIISRPWATRPSEPHQYGHCELHDRAGFPRVAAAHYSDVGKKLSGKLRLCDKCYRRVSEKGVRPSKADVRHLEKHGHRPAMKAVKA